MQDLRNLRINEAAYSNWLTANGPGPELVGVQAGTKTRDEQTAEKIMAMKQQNRQQFFKLRKHRMLQRVINHNRFQNKGIYYSTNTRSPSNNYETLNQSYTIVGRKPPEIRFPFTDTAHSPVSHTTEPKSPTSQTVTLCDNECFKVKAAKKFEFVHKFPHAAKVREQSAYRQRNLDLEETVHESSET